MLMEDIRTKRSCKSSIVTMSMKDAPYRLKSKALGRYIDLGHRSVFEYMRQAEQCGGCPRRLPTFSIAHEPLQDASMRSGELTQAIAGCNDEVGRTADPPSSCR